MTTIIIGLVCFAAGAAGTAWIMWPARGVPYAGDQDLWRGSE